MSYFAGYNVGEAVLYFCLRESVPLPSVSFIRICKNLAVQLATRPRSPIDRPFELHSFFLSTAEVRASIIHRTANGLLKKGSAHVLSLSRPHSFSSLLLSPSLPPSLSLLSPSLALSFFLGNAAQCFVGQICCLWRNLYGATDHSLYLSHLIMRLCASNHAGNFIISTHLALC